MYLFFLIIPNLEHHFQLFWNDLVYSFCFLGLFIYKVVDKIKSFNTSSVMVDSEEDVINSSSAKLITSSISLLFERLLFNQSLK